MLTHFIANRAGERRIETNRSQEEKQLDEDHKIIYALQPGENGSQVPPRVVGSLSQDIAFYRRNDILWLADAKKQETFERRFQIMAEEVLAGKPTSMH